MLDRPLPGPLNRIVLPLAAKPKAPGGGVQDALVASDELLQAIESPSRARATRVALSADPVSVPPQVAVVIALSDVRSCSPELAS
jgi:hypothetical protein